jgi:hypothetical protein
MSFVLSKRALNNQSLHAVVAVSPWEHRPKFGEADCKSHNESQSRAISRLLC